jgi:hypothetical protein
VNRPNLGFAATSAAKGHRVQLNGDFSSHNCRQLKRQKNCQM